MTLSQSQELLRKVEAHLEELRDAFARGALECRDGKLGLRSNRNMDLLVEVWKFNQSVEAANV